jgi:hypothetical protein
MFAGTEGPGTQTFFGKDPKALDAVPAPVHQAVPEHIAQPPPAPLAELKISPNGECKLTANPLYP